MVKTRLYNGTLCETYSDENKKLLQVETNTKYGSSCIDVLEGFDEQGKPYCRYTYIETDEEDIVDEYTEGSRIEQ